ncbi:MAG: GAF domain-containing protein [Cyanobacteria bacterium CAN_BIN43]|nr:GAF domain-containing protein [Cyanobacteria bacterium CAN_BIN43]
MIQSDFAQLTAPLNAVFASHDEPEALFEALLPAVCEVLQTDRCFLVVRQPVTRLSRIFCWRRSPEFPDFATDHWEIEQSWEDDDPMFAAALRAAPSIFVEDVETAGADVLNVEFERANFGHRALIHAHICQDGTLHGILQPCIFGQPRIWSDRDRQVVAQVIEQVRPFVVRYGETASL